MAFGTAGDRDDRCCGDGFTAVDLADEAYLGQTRDGTDGREMRAHSPRACRLGAASTQCSTASNWPWSASGSKRPG